MKVYSVLGVTGFYDTRDEWVEKSFFHEKDAIAFVELKIKEDEDRWMTEKLSSLEISDSRVEYYVYENEVV